MRVYTVYCFRVLSVYRLDYEGVANLVRGGADVHNPTQEDSLPPLHLLFTRPGLTDPHENLDDRHSHEDPEDMTTLVLKVTQSCHSSIELWRMCLISVSK